MYLCLNDFSIISCKSVNSEKSVISMVHGRNLSGKANPDILNSYIFPFLGVPNESVVVPPTVGFDAGVFKLDKERFIVAATDPVLGIPTEYFGFFIFHYSASDVAVFGAKPQYLINSVIFPENYNLEIVKKIFVQLNEECLKYNVSILTGHTGFYPSVTTPLANSTVIGFVDQEHLVLPSNAKPGDLILLTKSLGLEVAVMMTFSNSRLMQQFLSTEEINRLKSKITSLTVVPEAMLLSQNLLANAMHDVTEGGLSTALPEVANAANLGFVIYEEKLPYLPIINQIATEYDVNSLAFSSTGTLLAAVSPDKVQRAQEILLRNEIQSVVIGKFVNDPRVRKIKSLSNNEEKNFPEFIQDPYSKLINL